MPPTPLRILVVDDDPISRCILEEHVTAAGHDVLCVESAARAMSAIEREPVHIVIADWLMPDVSGLDLCRWVRGRHLPLNPHFVMLTVLNDKARLVEAFDAGADDFLSKPFHEPELVARLRAWARLVALQEELELRHRESVRLTSELLAVNERLSEVATRDELTGLNNRREGLRRLDEQLAVADRYARPLACAAVDVDHFKRLNDAHGHAAGDAVLRRVGQILRDATRAADGAFRTGGDEFLILLPDQDARAAAAWADRFCRAVEAEPVTFKSLALDVTVSVGVAERTGATSTADALLEAADAALYAAKRDGRNGVRRAPRPLSA